MLDKDDPIILILKGEKFDDEIPEPEDDKIKDISENKINEKEEELNNESKDKEDNSKKNQIQGNEEELNKAKNLKELEGEKVKKIDEFFPKNLSPLDFVNYIEVERINGITMKEMQNFILENHMKKDNKYEVLETKSLTQINNEIAEIDIKLIFAKKDIILFYTQNNNILTFSIKKQNFIKKIIPKNIKNSYINCLDITDDLNELICGYKDGVIEVINLNNGETKYSNNKINKGFSCIELKIYKKEKNEIHFISTNEEGNAYYNIIKIGLTSILWRMKSEPILADISKHPIYLIKIFDKSLNLNENYIILGSIDEIHIYCIEPDIEELFSIKKPEFIEECIVPDSQVAFDKDNEDKILLIISWANIIYFYSLEINKNTINKKEIGNYINENNILRTGFFNSSVVYLINENFSMTLIDIRKIKKGKIKLSKDNQINKRPIIPEGNNLAEIEKNYFVSPTLFSQSKIFDDNKNLIKTYLYTIIENKIENNLSLIILGSKQIYIISLSDWNTYLNNFAKREII